MLNPNKLIALKLLNILHSNSFSSIHNKVLHKVIAELITDEISLDIIKSEIKYLSNSFMLDANERCAYKDVWVWIDD